MQIVLGEVAMGIVFQVTQTSASESKKEILSQNFWVTRYFEVICLKFTAWFVVWLSISKYDLRVCDTYSSKERQNAKIISQKIIC